MFADKGSALWFTSRQKRNVVAGISSLKVKSEVHVSTSTSLTTQKPEWCPHYLDTFANNENERFLE